MKKFCISFFMAGLLIGALMVTAVAVPSRIAARPALVIKNEIAYSCYFLALVLAVQKRLYSLQHPEYFLEQSSQYSLSQMQLLQGKIKKTIPIG